MRIVILSFDLCFDVAGAYFPLSCFDSSESQKCTNQLQLDINQHMWMSSVFVGSAIIISRPSALQNNLQLWSCYVTVAQEVRIGFRPSIGNNMRLKYLFNRIRWLKNEYMYYVPNLSCLNLTYSQGNKTCSHIPSLKKTIRSLLKKKLFITLIMLWLRNRTQHLGTHLKIAENECDSFPGE